MARTPYVHCNVIQVTSDNATYHQKAVACLNQINATRVGQDLYGELVRLGKTIVIAPTAAPNEGNKCTSGGDAVFYRLRAALRDSPVYTIQRELGLALMGAAAAGWTIEKIGYTLAVGLSPATVRTINNQVNVNTMTEGARRMVGERIADLIEQAADGGSAAPLKNAPRGSHSLADLVVRFLRPWMAPGTGAGSRVNFNPDSLLSCMGDRMKRRPPAIGLAHELCHAWRNAAGQRLFDDALSCGLDDDEVMTTGFPPFQYEKFSENLFRSQWRTKLEMRVNYR
jgi:hypothetical protein